MPRREPTPASLRPATRASSEKPCGGPRRFADASEEAEEAGRVLPGAAFWATVARPQRVRRRGAASYMRNTLNDGSGIGAFSAARGIGAFLGVRSCNHVLRRCDVEMQDLTLTSERRRTS